LTSERLIRLSAALALFAIALMAWSLLGSSVVSIMVAMTIGQAVGTVSLLLYVLVLWREFRRSRLLEESEPEEPS
jgi:preprotein translocase subunit SecF